MRGLKVAFTVASFAVFALLVWGAVSSKASDVKLEPSYGFTLFRIENRREVPVGTLTFTFEILDRRNSSIVSADPAITFFPVPTGEYAEDYLFRINLVLDVPKQNLREVRTGRDRDRHRQEGREDQTERRFVAAGLEFFYSFGGSDYRMVREPSERDCSEAYHVDLPLYACRNGLRSMTLQARYKAGRSYTIYWVAGLSVRFGSHGEGATSGTIRVPFIEATTDINTPQRLMEWMNAQDRARALYGNRISSTDASGYLQRPAASRSHRRLVPKVPLVPTPKDQAEGEPEGEPDELDEPNKPQPRTRGKVDPECDDPSEEPCDEPGEPSEGDRIQGDRRLAYHVDYYYREVEGRRVYKYLVLKAGEVDIAVSACLLERGKASWSVKNEIPRGGWRRFLLHPKFKMEVTWVDSQGQEKKDLWGPAPHKRQN